MFIETETTPNPATLKFLPGRAVMSAGTADFPDVSQAARSPLAKRLFGLPGVTGVFLGADFITVAKADTTEWFELKPRVLGTIMEHFTSGEPVVTEAAPAAAEEEGDEVVAQIKELLETRVRPAVAQDGGDIIFDHYAEGVVYLHMQGSCSGCPSSTATLTFLPGRAVMSAGTADFRDETQAARSRLARRLFGLRGVTGVFLGADFITVAKADSAEWFELKPRELGTIMEHFTSGEAAVNESVPAASSEDEGDEVVAQIKELLETRVRPAVAQDGGDIIFDHYADGVVYLHMQGSCSGCPSSTATLKAGIENMLRHYVPEVTEVRAV